MSVELKEARKILDTMEYLGDNPELIMTDLYKDGIDYHNFLTNVNINGKTIIEILFQYLQSLDVFEGCIVYGADHSIVYSDRIFIYVPSLKCGNNQGFITDDKIMIINVDDKSYKLSSKAIDDYVDSINEKYDLMSFELSPFWKKYENFNLKNRIKNAFLSLRSSKKMHIRLWDFIYILFCSRKKIDSCVDKEKEKVRVKNESELKYYNERIERQNILKENFPEHIDMIRDKQNKIAGFLTSIGYRTDETLSEW